METHLTPELEYKLKEYFFSISTPEIVSHIKDELWISIVDHIKVKEKTFLPSKSSTQKYYMVIVKNYTMTKRYMIRDYLDGKGTPSGREWCDRLFRRTNRNRILSNILEK